MARPAKNKETSRLNLEVSLSVRERLDQLRDLSDADSLTEVIRSALAVYEVVLQEVKRGGEVILCSPDGVQRKLVIV